MADSLTGILSLLQSLSSKTGTATTEDGGSTTTSSGGTITSTKQTVLSQDAMNAMLKSALEGTSGTSGLADVVGGQNKAGLYNSSTNSMLTNDLLSRLATQVAVAGAPTTTTQVNPITTQVTSPSSKTTNTTTPAAVSATGAGLALGGVTALGAAKPFLDKLLNAKKVAGASAAETASEAVGNSASQSSESIAAMNGEVSTDTAAYLNSTVDATSVGTDVASEALGGGSDGAIAPVMEAIQDTANEALGGVVDSIAGGIAGSLADSLGSSTADAIGTTIGDSFVEYGGNAMAEAAAAEASSVAASEAANIGSSFCFLTTAVCEYQQKPDNCPELETLRAFRDGWLKENHPADIATYYAKAPAIVEKLKASPSAVRIFDEMYYGFILVALRQIDHGNLEGAYYTYKALYHFCSEV